MYSEYIYIYVDVDTYIDIDIGLDVVGLLSRGCKYEGGLQHVSFVHMALVSNAMHGIGFGTRVLK